MAYIIDTERVINEVRMRRELWDMSHNLYKDKDARLAAWKNVCISLIPEYADVTVFQQKEIDKMVQQRWKTARDAYNRCKASLKFQSSGSGGKPKKKYIYYDYLQFLEKTISAHDEDSMTSERLVEIPTTQATEEDLDNQNSSIITEIPKQENAGTSKQSEQVKGKNKMSRKRKYSNNDNTDECDKALVEILKEHANNMKNDDMAFFYSLNPILQKFSDYQKLLFRSEVLSAALRISRTSGQASST